MSSKKNARSSRLVYTSMSHLPVAAQRRADSNRRRIQRVFLGSELGR